MQTTVATEKTTSVETVQARRAHALDALSDIEKRWHSYSNRRRSFFSSRVIRNSQYLLEQREIVEEQRCGTVRLVLLERSIEQLAVEVQRDAARIEDIVSASQLIKAKLYEARLPAVPNVPILAAVLERLVEDFLALDPGWEKQLENWAIEQTSRNRGQCPNAYI